MPANFHVHGNQQEILLECRFGFGGPGAGLRACNSRERPGAAGAADL